MSFGNLVKDSSGIPIAQGYIPGTGFQGLQSSLVKNTDGSSNASAASVFSDVRVEAVMNGQAFTVVQNQTIGGAATGQYAVSVFNPSNSGKNILIFSIKCMTNFGNCTVWLYQTTTNPAYNTTLTPKNMLGGGSVSSLASGSITANSASISFPASQVDMTIAQPEVLMNNATFFLPNGSANGLTSLVNVGNSQAYSICVKWIEF